MRPRVKIERDCELASGTCFDISDSEIAAAQARLSQDIPDLLAALAKKDAEIERLEEDRRRLIGFRHCPQCGDWLIDIDYGDGRIGGMGCIECDFEMEVR